MDGIIRLQTEADTIIPDANPVKARRIPKFISFFINKTKAEPREVPRKGMRIPIKAFKVIETLLYS